jgi:hypothetical protein
MPEVSLKIKNEPTNGRPSVSTGAYQIDGIEATKNLVWVFQTGWNVPFDPVPAHPAWRRLVPISKPEKNEKVISVIAEGFREFCENPFSFGFA